MTLNAFATGSPATPSSASPRACCGGSPCASWPGVLAHELSHVRNNDLAVMRWPT
jgi:hypothetical protein